MYESFYQLKAEPFRLSPDHKFCFSHKSYRKAKAYMQYAYQRAEGFVMITGRPGTGKSTLVNDLVSSLTGERVDVAKLVCTQLEANDLLRMVAHAFKINTVGEQKSTILQNLGRKLALNYKDEKRTLLIIDEAQDLSLSALEELRLLTNLQIKNQPLLQIFLLGQDELRGLIQNPSMEQVHQRIVAACHLEPLLQDETKSYILHRLGQAGWKGRPAISDAVYPVIYKFSQGIPRRINLICSRLFLHGCVEEKYQFGIEDIKAVVIELQREQLTSADMYSDTDFLEDDYFEPHNLGPVPDLQSDTEKKELPASKPEGNASKTCELQVVNTSVDPDKDTPASHLKKKSDLNTEANPFINDKYIGPERREQVRRTNEERRISIRFEPHKEDRRKKSGRRKDDISRHMWRNYDI